ncbi:alpha/beta fold hydrolase [Streptomyces coffeae]|uniref:Alpha/beta fold hydrolase n=1 Tax=Streptomyces coffeae TaxID=621382 RepID=A0ABS1NLQ5_9ACTN|nr:alpha/beta fold hydrolase [Streptomyces coffeae]MBL1101030.1 alpha/beta fold hydrolase [Streptomyces coffeae]
MGSFTVGGRQVRVSGQPTYVVALSENLPEYIVDPNGTYCVEHAYVQYYIPAEERHLPVILVHGGGMTGSCWESTPDGRDGWAAHFLRDGHPVYVIDTSERGRAGWWPLPGMAYEQRPLLRSAEEAWDVFRVGPSGGYDALQPYPGCLFPLGHFDQACCQIVPRWTTTTDPAVEALEALIAKTGRCAVIAHSHGGGIAARAVARDPELVAALVLLEPNGLPVPLGAEEVGATPRLIVAGDFIQQSPLYAKLSPSWPEYLERVTSAGTRADYFDLPAMGHPGNSHMLMMDRNSDFVADLIQQWMDHMATGDGTGFLRNRRAS